MSSSSGEPLAVVAVHGVGYRDARATAEQVRAAHLQSWTRHLADGMGIETSRLALDFAYYAHLLHTGPTVQGTQDTDELQDPLAKELTAAWLAELGAPRPVAQGALTMPLRYVASWVAKKFSLDGRLTELFIRVFFREVAAYLADVDSPARAAVREGVAARIARHRPRVVLAHSLGTVVAYEALHAHPELQVELLVTLGSPLALPHGVFDRLVPGPTGAPPARPLRRSAGRCCAVGEHRGSRRPGGHPAPACPSLHRNQRGPHRSHSPDLRIPPR
ncbi:hypothetical protein [Streptomyces sp. NBC_00280]|uniref:hypothetical protein n=1 Tax=Streptomyces sp. NBC_00280 TaxID=2975699 RepID=UPI0032517EFE